MPIEIRELIIRARVDPTADSVPDETGVSAGQEPDREDLVQTCVREVLRILEDQKER